MSRTRIPRRARRTLVAMAIAMVLLGACSSDDDGDTDAAEDASSPTIVTDESAPTDDGAANGVDPDAAAPDLPADYPLPIPDGGTILTAIFDDATETSRVVVAYPSESVDGLVAAYDSFFDGIGGETTVVALTDGLGSWQNDDAGYSVVLNAQNPDVQVTLQTGI